MSSVLKPEALEFLKKKTGLAEKTLRNQITKLRSKSPGITINGAAHMLAMQHKTSLLGKLSDEDKASLPNLELDRSKVKLPQAKPRTKEKILNVLVYDTDDPFIKGHITEVNRAFTYSCFTSVNILARKVIENLIIDILIAKYPSSSKENKEKYYDTAKRRNKDFSVILQNLYDSRHDFEPKKVRMIQRLHSKAKAFKDEANNKAHSWYYLVKRRKEIEDIEIQFMIDLIKGIQS